MTSGSDLSLATHMSPEADAELLVWLRQAGEPGSHAFRTAARATTASFALVIGFWAAIACTLRLLLDGGGTQLALPTALVLVAAAAAAAAVARHRARVEAQRGRDQVAAALRHDLLGAVLPLAGSASVQAGAPTGAEAAHAVIELSDQIAEYHQLTRPARAAALPSGGLVLAAVALVHWPVALLLVLVTPILPLNLRLAGLATEDASRRQLDAVRRLAHELLDRFRGMRTLVTLGAVDSERRVVQRAADDLNTATTVVLRQAFVVSMVTDAVVTVSIAVSATYVGMVLLGYVRLPGAPHLGFGAGLLVLLLCPVYFAPLRAYSAGFHERDQALAAARILREQTGRPAAVGPRVAAPDVVARSAPTGQPVPVPLVAAPTVELDRLTVVFPGSRRAVLDELTAWLPPGSVTVLSAPSGQGKTTLLRVVGGLGAPSSGAVRLHVPGTGVRLPVAGLASWIGQQTVLLPGTLAANLALGAPTASLAELTTAAVSAGLGPLLARLPDGLSTEIGDEGWGISAGEGRRVALARALLRDAPLWLLDEPTAHLDAESECELVELILRGTAGRTVLIATHSAAIRERADTVWRLDRGSLSVEPQSVGPRSGSRW